MINPFRPSAKVIIKKVEINIRGGGGAGGTGGGGRTKLFKGKKNPLSLSS